MAYFDNIDLGNPDAQSALGWLSGLAGGFAQAAMPSRAPIPFGAALGNAFSAANAGAMEGGRNAQAYQKGNLELQQGNLGMAQALAGINYYRQRAGLDPISLEDLKPGKKLDLFGKPKGQTEAKASPVQATTNFMPKPVQRATLPPIGSDGMFGAPDDTVPAIRSAESGGNVNAVSPAGARGPMQLMPGTQAQPGFGVKPAADDSPAENDREGRDYYMAMLKKYGNQSRALVAYNMGPGATDKWIADGADMKKLPKEVKQYVGSVALGVPVSAIPRYQGADAQTAPQADQQQLPAGAGEPYNVMDSIAQIGMFSPEQAMKLQEKMMEPQNMRPGNVLTTIGPDGKPHVLVRNPNLSQNLDYDPETGRAFKVPGAQEGAAELEHATETAKKRAEYPYERQLAYDKAAANAGGKMATDNHENFLDTGGLGLGTAGGGLRALPATPAPGSQGEPQPVLHGNTGGVRSTIPSISEAAPINPADIYLKDRVKQWTDQEDNWYDALPSNITGEQRAMAIADALKRTESGSWAEEKAGVKADLKALGIDVGDNVLGDPAEVQKVLKDNFSSTLAQIRAFTSRPAAVEVQLASKNFANPDLQPSANLAIISQTVGSLRWERALMNDWAKAKEMGWKDPQDFMRAWVTKNPMQKYIDATAKEIGPLKGMKAPPQLPPAAIKQLKAGTITHFKNGQSWTLGPDGQPQQVK